MQLRNEPVTLRLVDHEGEVEVVGGLADEVDLLLLEQLERLAELVDDRADVPSQQRQRGTGTDHLDAAQPRQVRHQGVPRVLVERVGLRVERDGHVRLGRRDQVDREAVLLEDGECIGQEADLVPHAGAFHRYQGDALADRDRLDLSAAVRGLGTDDGAGLVRALRREDVQRDPRLACRKDAPRVQHLGAVGGDLLRLVVMQRLQQPGRGNIPRVGREHARDVRPDLEPGGGKLRRDVGRGGVRTAPTQQHGASLSIGGNETLGEDRATLGREPCRRLRVRVEVAGRREQRRALRRPAPFLRPQQFPCVHPRRGNVLRIEEGSADLGGHQLARRHHARPDTIADLAHEGHPSGELLQVCEVALDPGRHRDAEFRAQVHVAPAQGRQRRSVLALQGAREQRLERVGDLRQRGVDDHGRLASGEPAPGDRGDVLPVRERRHAGAAELHDDDRGAGSNGHGGS